MPITLENWHASYRRVEKSEVTIGAPSSHGGVGGRVRLPLRRDGARGEERAALDLGVEDAERLADQLLDAARAVREIHGDELPGLADRTYYASWTYVANYGGPHERRARSPHAAAMSVFREFDSDFSCRGVVHVADRPLRAVCGVESKEAVRALAELDGSLRLSALRLAERASGDFTAYPRDDAPALWFAMGPIAAPVERAEEDGERHLSPRRECAAGGPEVAAVGAWVDAHPGEFGDLVRAAWTRRQKRGA
jgi:hypothetical protein